MSPGCDCCFLTLQTHACWAGPIVTSALAVLHGVFVPARRQTQALVQFMACAVHARACRHSSRAQQLLHVLCVLFNVCGGCTISHFGIKKKCMRHVCAKGMLLLLLLCLVGFFRGLLWDRSLRCGGRSVSWCDSVLRTPSPNILVQTPQLLAARSMKYVANIWSYVVFGSHCGCACSAGCRGCGVFRTQHTNAALSVRPDCVRRRGCVCQCTLCLAHTPGVCCPGWLSWCAMAHHSVLVGSMQLVWLQPAALLCVCAPSSRMSCGLRPCNQSLLAVWRICLTAHVAACWHASC
jgi:hypothetical protein